MNNLITKYGKKKVYAFFAAMIFTFTAAGFGIWYVMEDNYKNGILDSIDLSFVESPVIEYGTENFDFNSLIKDKVGEPGIILPDPIDTKMIGKKEVNYTLSKEGYEKELKVEVEIKDTKAPVITLNDDAPTINVDGEFDVEKNITSVKDPVDGDIAFLSSDEIETKKSGLQEGETLKGYYTIDGTVDTATAGEYAITIFAIDINGNETKKEFVVSVLEEDEEDTAVSGNNGSSNGTSNYYQPAGGYGGSSGGGNGGGSSNGGSSSGGGNTCDASALKYPLPAGITMKATMQEAGVYADGMARDPNSPFYLRPFSVGPVFNQCNEIIGYIPYFR